MSYAIIQLKNLGFLKSVRAEQILDELKIDVNMSRKKNVQRYAKKICRILKKYKTSNIIMQNELLDNEEFKNILYQNNNYIITGNRLYKVLILKTIKDICSNMKIEMNERKVCILTNEYSIENIDLIECLSEEVKSVCIVTNNVNRFEKFSEYLLSKNGAAIRVLDAEKNYTYKSDFIVNLDYTEEMLRRLKINRECIIISVNEKITGLKKSFNGIIINDIDIWLDKEINNISTLSICEAYIYNYLKKIKENERIFEKSGYRINGYYGLNGKIDMQEFERIGKNLKMVTTKK